MDCPFLRRIALVAVTAAISCVPAATDKTEPRGAAGARLVPSDVARGAPFRTDDGWTVTIERFAIVARVSTQSRAGRDGESGPSGAVLWDGMRASEWYGTAIPVGGLAVEVEPSGLSHPARISDYYASDENRLQQEVAASTLSPEVQALVLAVPDNYVAMPAEYADYVQTQGPAVIFAAHAAKAGRTVRLALALGAASQSGASTQQVEVQANAVRFAVYEVLPNRIFAATADEAPTLFDPIAAADRDGDGVVTAAELRAVPLVSVVPDAGGIDIDPSVAPSCSESGLDVSACWTLLDRIADNAAHIVVPATTSQ